MNLDKEKINERIDFEANGIIKKIWEMVDEAIEDVTLDYDLDYNISEQDILVDGVRNLLVKKIKKAFGI